MRLRLPFRFTTTSRSTTRPSDSRSLLASTLMFQPRANTSTLSSVRPSLGACMRACTVYYFNNHACAPARVLVFTTMGKRPLPYHRCCVLRRHVNSTVPSRSALH